MENNNTQNQRLTVVDRQIVNSSGRIIATYKSHLEAFRAFRALCLATRS